MNALDAQVVCLPELASTNLGLVEEDKMDLGMEALQRWYKSETREKPFRPPPGLTNSLSVQSGFHHVKFNGNNIAAL